MNALSAKPVSPRFSLRSALVHRHQAHGRQKVELIRLIGSLCHDKPAELAKK
jgi:hypothetical protein